MILELNVFENRNNMLLLDSWSSLSRMQWELDALLSYNFSTVKYAAFVQHLDYKQVKRNFAG